MTGHKKWCSTQKINIQDTNREILKNKYENDKPKETREKDMNSQFTEE